MPDICPNIPTVNIILYNLIRIHVRCAFYIESMACLRIAQTPAYKPPFPPPPHTHTLKNPLVIGPSPCKQKDKTNNYYKPPSK